jgi:hypothetical protein
MNSTRVKEGQTILTCHSEERSDEEPGPFPERNTDPSRSLS